MNNKISDKGKQDWEEFLAKDQEFPNKDNLGKKKTRGKVRLLDLHGYTLDEANKTIENFIKKCKTLEDQNGYISHTLFELNLNSKYKFASGPFVEKIFQIIDLQKNKINILMGNIKTTVRTQEFIFKPI